MSFDVRLAWTQETGNVEQWGAHWRTWQIWWIDPCAAVMGIALTASSLYRAYCISNAV